MCLARSTPATAKQHMKFLKETTEWPDSTPNHTYLVDDSKTYMHGYVPRDEVAELQQSIFDRISA
jgi:hypothetical protein